MAFLATVFNVMAAILFNLISELVGGLRIMLVEEESTRFRPARARPMTIRRPTRRPISRPRRPPPATPPAPLTPERHSGGGRNPRRRRRSRSRVV